MWNLKQDGVNLKEFEVLKYVKFVVVILLDILEYWEICVVEKKRG